MELTEQHLALLRTAADRDDGLLRCPDRLVGAARRRMANRLLAGGVAVTASAYEDQPYWFKDGKGALAALRMTEAGRAVVADACGESVPKGAAPDSVRSVRPAGTTKMHRLGTKRALLLDLLCDRGTTLAELAETLGWQPHTVRAALTRLRHDRMTIVKVMRQGGTTYRIGNDTARKVSADVGEEA